MKRSMAIARFLAVSGIYLLAGTPAAMAQTSTPVSAAATTTSAPAVPAPGSAPVSRKLVSSFEALAGSEENAASLVNGLRSGSRITLTAEAPGGATGGTPPAGGASFVPPTRPMGWGNVRHALTLAQRQLAAQGITNPTPSQLQAALTGGSVTTSSGQSVTLAGTLTLRSQGRGWGQIAHTLGVPMGNAASIHASSHHDAAATAGAQIVSASGQRVGTVTNASGAVVRSAHWSGAGSSHARSDGDAGARSSAAQVLPTTARSGFSVAAGHGGGSASGGHGGGR